MLFQERISDLTTRNRNEPRFNRGKRPIMRAIKVLNPLKVLSLSTFLEWQLVYGGYVFVSHGFLQQH